jgi:hypothetical protein
MKATKIMLACIATFIATWLLLGFIGYLFSDAVTYKECCTHGGLIICMVCIGWVPALVVGADLHEYLD